MWETGKMRQDGMPRRTSHQERVINPRRWGQHFFGEEQVLHCERQIRYTYMRQTHECDMLLTMAWSVVNTNSTKFRTITNASSFAKPGASPRLGAITGFFRALRDGERDADDLPICPIGSCQRGRATGNERSAERLRDLCQAIASGQHVKAPLSRRHVQPC